MYGKPSQVPDTTRAPLNHEDGDAIRTLCGSDADVDNDTI